MTFTNKKILIFGGTGSLGYEITKDILMLIIFMLFLEMKTNTGK